MSVISLLLLLTSPAGAENRKMLDELSPVVAVT